MKAKTTFVLCLVTLFSWRGTAQFEGIIQSKNLSVDDLGVAHEYKMTIWVKKDFVRVTVPKVGVTPGSTVIYRTDNNISWVLNDDDRTFFEVALTSLRGSQEDVRPDPNAMEAPKVDLTRKKRKILGFTCEQVVISRGETVTEIWGAKGLEDLARVLHESLEPGQQGMMEEDTIAKMGFFPLVSVLRYEGRVLESQEVTKIERATLASELFQIPEGYKKQKALDVE
ncbi:MAG: DUF4412 domain-containing protein [Bacteroidetes bacterium]|nr:DUF4412 domain-containing protein [Bacteroidota bacterium]